MSEVAREDDDSSLIDIPSSCVDVVAGEINAAAAAADDDADMGRRLLLAIMAFRRICRADCCKC
jgi:hypothetical protein